MNETKLIKQIARLESLQDQLLTEISYLDHLLRLIGFEEGLKTVKSVAQEMDKKDPTSRENN